MLLQAYGHRSLSAGETPNMTRFKDNVVEFLLDGKQSDRIALQLLDTTYSYGELRDTASRIATYLLQMGSRKGDRVILISDNSFFWVAAYLGILRAGLVCVPLPAAVSPNDLDYILQNTEAKIAFLQAGLTRKIGSHFTRIQVITDREAPLVPGLAAQKMFGDVLSETPASQDEVASAGGDDLAALMFTSGSTGTPRGVIVSHANIIANTHSIVQYLGLTERDRIMTVLPFHYCFGTSLLHTHLRAGGSLVIDLRFMYPEKVLERMLETECTGFGGVPSHFQILLRSSSLRKKSFPHLRYVQQAGGHLAPGFVRELREALPNTQIYIMYGQTEATSRLSYLPPEFLDTKPGSIGRGIPGVKLRVLNESGGEVRPGEVGEIVAEGENITRGYWSAPEESAVTYRDGQLYTGDLATVDEDGFIYIVDRAKDFLKCGGKRVSCRQLEDQLLAFGELLEAAVIGVPDEILGEAVKVFVVPRNGNPTGLEDRLRAFCKEHIPPQQFPKQIIVVSSLPKNSSGKIIKRELHAL
jgi:long-chain acyl-CoA synthetase